jgi:hypothetical protein
MQRRPRANDERVQVWYGKLASGDDLRENPQQRHQLKERYDIKGFETGAASVMDVFERVSVIRGVWIIATDTNHGVAAIRFGDSGSLC